MDREGWNVGCCQWIGAHWVAATGPTGGRPGKRDLLSLRTHYISRAHICHKRIFKLAYFFHKNWAEYSLVNANGSELHDTVTSCILWSLERLAMSRLQILKTGLYWHTIEKTVSSGAFILPRKCVREFEPSK